MTQSVEMLVEAANKIWVVGAKKRKFALWRNEVTKLIKKIESNLDYQEEALIKCIKSGQMPTELIADCDQKIENSRQYLKEWIEQICRYTGGAEIDIEEKVESFEDAANKAEIKIKASKVKKEKK